ncbi:CRISPR-associated protein Cas4 [Desulfovibrio litoralis]|uniref:CRISPR-associated exonuclease Cas4 n=1 Tax=Desulfovibrio litoralis DSM 11393 TaxID=1121455 RepID=A0A1M7TRG0_9BACT|nr:CRISPR-associated protein Cas4 [Desulfovibrio litoralis]SHN73256.1 CRISPR-associated exonuclease, Cas4 family [Desulfovibrio litoralis DSM 11393]
MYSEDDLLALSGLQHLAFCERQWALIHIEQQWTENLLTVQGNILHERVDDPSLVETRNGVIISRAMPIQSFRLGLSGVADVVEFHQVKTADNAIKIAGKDGFWRPFIIEYKRGKPKITDIDKIQLMAQTICLEEMFSITIQKGSFFYNEIKRRDNIEFDSDLRNKTEKLAERMHYLFQLGQTPKAKYTKLCKACSLYDLCLPKMPKTTVKSYINSCLEEGGGLSDDF